jgi:hypothetical protein
MNELVGSIFRQTTTKTHPAITKTTAMPKIDSNGNSGDFFIRMAFDIMVASKEYRKNDALRNAIQAATGIA